MPANNLVTEETRLIEIGTAVVLAKAGERALLVGHLHACRDVMQIPVQQLRETARNMADAASEDLARAGEMMLKALEDVADADAA